MNVTVCLVSHENIKPQWTINEKGAFSHWSPQICSPGGGKIFKYLLCRILKLFEKRHIDSNILRSLEYFLICQQNQLQSRICSKRHLDQPWGLCAAELNIFRDSQRMALLHRENKQTKYKTILLWMCPPYVWSSFSVLPDLTTACLSSITSFLFWPPSYPYLTLF